MITFTTWLWGDGYGEHYVRKICYAIRRNIKSARFLVLVDKFRPTLPALELAQHLIPDDALELTKVKGCFARLKLFDPEYQHQLSICPEHKIVNLDLDLVVTGNLEWLEHRDDDFAIVQNINTTNPCPYNGSVWMLKAGYRPDVWTDFSLEAAGQVPFHAFPDDQGWFHHKMPDAGSFGPDCGVYGFKKRGWPSGNALPENASIVAFPGWRDPMKFEHLPWVKENWRER